MFHAKSNITAGLAAIFMLTVSVAFASDDPAAIKLRLGTGGDPVAGKTKSELCQGCHGEDGNSSDTLIPKLSGQYGQYIAKQLRNYQSGDRTHDIMSAMATTIDDADLADIAAYFASQKQMKGDRPGNNAGKKLFFEGDMARRIIACKNCHGADGKGKSPSLSMFPVIGGQHKDYLRLQLASFRKGDRSNSPGGIMNIIAKTMTDAEIDALADFVAGL